MEICKQQLKGLHTKTLRKSIGLREREKVQILSVGAGGDNYPQLFT